MGLENCRNSNKMINSRRRRCKDRESKDCAQGRIREKHGGEQGGRRSREDSVLLREQRGEIHSL